MTFLEPRNVFDVALMGWGRRPADEEPILVYDWLSLIEAVAHWQQWDWERASEYVSTQIETAWVGPATPLILARSTATALEELL